MASQLSNLVFRIGRNKDFGAMYKACFADAPQEADHATYRQIKHEWDAFTKQATTVTIIVEEKNQQGSRICGCGQIVFVSNEFVEWAYQASTPGINREAANPEKQYLLSSAALKKANSAEGVNGLVTRWHAGTAGHFSEDDRVHIRAVLYRGMMSLFVGYKYRLILGETYGAYAVKHALDAGFSELRTFAHSCSDRPSDAPQYGVVHVTRQMAVEKQASQVSHLFLDYQQPKLHLNAYSQELLQLAALDYDDDEIAQVAGVNFESIQARWRKLFKLLQDEELVRRVLSPTTSITGTSSKKRGWMRRIWTRYAKEHPEELRPHDGQYYNRHRYQAALLPPTP